MAYLNVRERRIETTIAYVGAALSGKKTNFAELAKRCAPGRPAVVAEHPSGAEMSLAWKPSQTAAFRDCDLSVRLVSSAALGGSDRAREILRAADGVVVLFDAAPDARARNEETAAALKEVLASRAARKLPVVVQVNKTDLAGAASIASVLDGLGLDAWPHIGAAALRGEGVVETLDRAIGDVLFGLETPGDDDQDDEERASPGPVPNHTGSGSNPLLSALRQILRETVSEHVSAMEVRLASALTESLEAQAQKQTRLEERIDAQAQSFAGEMTTLSRAVQGLPQVMVDVVRSEVIRAVEQRSRADREHLATATGQLRRTLDALASESKPAETRARLEDVADAVGRLADGVGQSNATVAAVAARVDAVEKRVREGMAHELAEIEAALAHLGDRLADLAATGDARHAVTLATQTALTELVEELKKPKKSWFG